MDYSQKPTSNEQQSDSYGIDSIPHTTAAEERVLWRKYIKWRHIKRIPGSTSVLDDIHEASSIVISQIIKEISDSHDLVILLRRHSGLDELGDIILENDADNATYNIEVARLIFQHSKTKNDEKSIQKRNNNETCCLEEFFGAIFGDMLNHIAFDKGNPNLLDKITKESKANPDDIKERLYKLAINRELLPRSTITLLNPKTPLNRLPNLIASIPSDVFSEFASNYYQSFITSVKAEGEKALNRIIESNLWLVVDIVNKHFSQDVGVPRDDLIQEGNLGLLEAAERFQPTLVARFMQYANWWIFSKIHRTIADQARTIRIPVHILENINQLLRTNIQLSQKYGREPTETEISEEMGISSGKVKEIAKAAQLPVSFESLIGQEEDIEDQNAFPPFDVASKQLLKDQIDEVLSSLTPRECRVLQLRFGLEDGRSHTLEEIGQEFGVTRERIRQIEAKALRRLRHPSRSRKLKDYLE